MYILVRENSRIMLCDLSTRLQVLVIHFLGLGKVLARLFTFYLQLLLLLFYVTNMIERGIFSLLALYTNQL